MEPPAPLFIPARSKREAMDWSLVLISQQIQSTVDHDEEGWVVLVEPEDFDRASSLLKQWQLENRGWRWRRNLPGSPFPSTGAACFGRLRSLPFITRAFPDPSSRRA